MQRYAFSMKQPRKQPILSVILEWALHCKLRNKFTIFTSPNTRIILTLRNIFLLRERKFVPCLGKYFFLPRKILFLLIVAKRLKIADFVRLVGYKNRQVKIVYKLVVYTLFLLHCCVAMLQCCNVAISTLHHHLCRVGYSYPRNIMINRINNSSTFSVIILLIATLQRNIATRRQIYFAFLLHIPNIVRIFAATNRYYSLLT